MLHFKKKIKLKILKKPTLGFKYYKIKKIFLTKKKKNKLFIYRKNKIIFSINKIRLKKKIFFYKKKKEYFNRFRYRYYKKKLKNFLKQRRYLRKKKTKKSRIIFQYFKLQKKVDLKYLFFKKILFLKKFLILLFVNIALSKIKKKNLFFKKYNMLSFNEKFFFFFESRISNMLMRLKYSRSFYQAVRFVFCGAVLWNGKKITFLEFLIKKYDLIELSYIFYRYLFTKRFLRYRRFKRRIRRRSFYLCYFKKFYRIKFFKRKRFFLLFFRKNFFEKNRYLIASIILQIPIIIKNRFYTNKLSIKSIKLLSLYY
jgi:ribosomal protein S4